MKIYKIDSGSIIKLRVHEPFFVEANDEDEAWDLATEEITNRPELTEIYSNDLEIEEVTTQK